MVALFLMLFGFLKSHIPLKIMLLIKVISINLESKKLHVLNMLRNNSFMDKVLNEISIERQIIEEINRQNTTVNWVATQIHVTHHHLYKVLGMAQEKRKLTDNLKQKISEVLGTEF